MVDFTDWANIPLAMSANMPEVMTFKACFVISGVVTREGGVNGYAMNSACGIDFMMKFSALEG